MIYTLMGFMVLALWLMLTTKKLLHAAFGLMGVFLLQAALYVLLGADFVAIAQIVVYVGGILILMIFGIMFTARPQTWSLQKAHTEKTESNQPSSKSHQNLGGAILGILILSMLIRLVLTTPLSRYKVIESAENTLQNGTTYDIGLALMTEYLLPFEVIALVLLVVLVGATWVANSKNIFEKPKS
jgi:NADH-quinone oxidoreductase subunit J